MPHIKAGYGFNVGHDFARAAEDTPITIRVRQGAFTYGTIIGNPDSSFGFMRTATVDVRVRSQDIADL